jgi:hypothetical protein
MGGANALAQGLGTYLNYQQGQNYLNARFPQQAAPITDYSYSYTPSSYDELFVPPGG